MRNRMLIRILSIVMIIELGIFFYYYFFGSAGYKKIQELTQLQESIDESVNELRARVDDLQQDLHDMKTYPYYKEKIVREQLQMIKPNERIYKRS